VPTIKKKGKTTSKQSQQKDDPNLDESLPNNDQLQKDDPNLDESLPNNDQLQKDDPNLDESLPKDDRDVFNNYNSSSEEGNLSYFESQVLKELKSIKKTSKNILKTLKKNR
jgi:hypothetical protein